MKKENVILKEIEPKLNWKEKIILRMLKKYSYKILGISTMIAINDLLKE